MEDRISEEVRREPRVRPPVHLDPLGMTAHALAKKLGVPVPRVNDVVRGKRAISVDTALRLSRYFGNSAQFWLSLQNSYDLRIAEIEAGERIEREVEPMADAS
ncbi:MAG: HigA family addiction module antitoxin [Actinomycetota bacterium]|jgi:addiction module HigA family antidote|nr:HigA family addiction module antidote protein [Rubrobacter sp.]MDQ3509796.1 HigA family addiction module antitoxin [Actinomycetota bacterium]